MTSLQQPTKLKLQIAMHFRENVFMDFVQLQSVQLFFTKLWIPSLQLAPGYTVQGCRDGWPMTTYVILTDSAIEPDLPRQKSTGSAI